MPTTGCTVLLRRIDHESEVAVEFSWDHFLILQDAGFWADLDRAVGGSDWGFDCYETTTVKGDDCASLAAVCAEFCSKLQDDSSMEATTWQRSFGPDRVLGPREGVTHVASGKELRATVDKIAQAANAAIREEASLLFTL